MACIICARLYGPAKNEHLQNSVLLITLYMVYSNGNGLFSGAHTNVHGFGKWVVEPNILPLEEHGLFSDFLHTLLCSEMFLLPNPNDNELQMYKYV